MKATTEEAAETSTAVAPRAIAEEQRQAELAESETMQAQLDVTAAVRARAEEQIQTDGAEAEALKMQLDEVRATRARAHSSRPSSPKGKP